jgi:ATP-dependent Clp protease protease subunit
MPKTWFKASKTGTVGTVLIFSDIGAWGVSSESFRRDIDALGKVDTLDVKIASDGGDVATGFHIYNILASHPAHVVVTVEALAASMASVVAMAGDDVRMPKNAMMMIHNPFGAVQGQSDEIASFAEALAIMRENIIQAYVDRTGLSSEQVGTMMDKETWLKADKAVELGFADSVIAPTEMRASVNLAKFNKVPNAFGRSIQKETTAMTTPNEKVETDAEKTARENEAKKAARDSFKAYCADVRATCTLAGFPEKAEAFIDEDKAISEVIKSLGTLAAEKAAATATATAGKKKPGAAAAGAAAGEEISTRHSGRAAAGESEPATINHSDIYAKFNAHAQKRGH